MRNGKYEYHVNLNERGEFSADVRDDTGETVFEIDGFDVFEDGWMRSAHDMDGLTDYLAHLGIVPKYSRIEDCG